MKKQKKIYIAGRMVGFPFHNFHLFMAKEIELREQGWDVINPAVIDMACGENPFLLPFDHDWNTPPEDMDMKEVIRRDCNVIIEEADAIYMMKGWEKGTGAPAEHALANWLGLELIYEG